MSEQEKCMKKYVAQKEITATKMTRQEYHDYRGWELPKGENGKDEGYLVEDLDGNQSNHPDHEDYISWLPEAEFERAYRPSETFVDRLKIEERELREKIEKLDAALNTGGLDIPQDKVEMLIIQREVMRAYHQVLLSRIAAC